MKKIIKFPDNTVREYDLNRNGFIQALSFKESTSDLSLSPNHNINKIAAAKKSTGGHRGFFQMGESALFETGYYLGDKGIDFRKLDAKKDKALYDSVTATFDKNDWKGKWTGKNNIYSLDDFVKKPELQLKAVDDWINYLCKRMCLLDFNQYYGQIINGVEITESGAIAGAHLMGEGGLATFLNSPVFGKKKYKIVDDLGTNISSYVSMFGGFDLESCCNRKIYILLKDKNGVELKNKEIVVVSSNNGKYISGETRVKLKSDDQGKLPVIVRNPNTEIKILADGKESNPIIQKAEQKQHAVLNDFEVAKFPATLEENSTPQPKPQPTKTPQEVRNEQNSTEDKKDVVVGNTKNVSFNIQIIEEDTRKAISNMGFYLTYKGNIKKHTADSSGTKKGVVAEVGEDIEVTVSGAGQPQKIHHFKVEQSLSNQTIKIKLPVCSFKINVKENNKNVTNTLVGIFYRNKQISKRTDSNGDVSVKMLLGFVFGFGIKNKELEKLRVLKGLPIRYFKVNEGFVKASKLYEIADQKRKEADELKKKSDQMQQQQALEKKAKEQAEKAKSESEKNQPIQDNTYTENGGRPLTTASNQSPPTSDTTRYHIYHDGKIKRENKAATGYAEFIYYEANGTVHYLGKSAFIKANKYENYKDAKGKTQYRRVEGNSYLIDYSKHNNYRNNNIGYKWMIVSDDLRHYLSGIGLSAVLGGMCSLGYAEYHGSGFSKKDGSPGDSVSHINGECGDFRYIGTNNSHMTQQTYTTHNHFDWDKNVAFVEALFKFGFKSFLSRPVIIKGNIMLPKTTSWPGHHNHIHLQRLRANVQDI